MFSIAEFLERAKAGASIESDYRLGKVIGISHQVISGYRLGKSLPNEKVIGQLCALSGDDPGVIAAQIQAERSQSPEAKTMWFAIAKRLSGGASTAILSVVFAIALIAGYADPARAGEAKDPKTGRVNLLYIVSTTILSAGHFLAVRLRRWAGLFRLSLALCLAG